MKNRDKGKPSAFLKGADRRVKTVAYAGIFTAVITIVTAFIKIPMINGYAHIGDAFIVFAAAVMGPWTAVPAAIGSALADIISGYPQYAIPTLIIKGIMGLITGGAVYFAGKMSRRKGIFLKISAIVVAEAVMVAGYHVVGEIMYGAAAAIGELIGNLCQAGVGIVIGVIFLNVASYFGLGFTAEEVSKPVVYDETDKKDQ